MKTRFKLLTWNIEEERIFSRNCRNYSEAIQAAQALKLRQVYPHDILKIFELKRTGHKWDITVWDPKKPQKIEHVFFYSKKDAIFAIKVIKEYDSSLKVNLIKKY